MVATLIDRIQEWKGSQPKDSVRAGGLLSERWLQGKLMSLGFLWKVFYDYAGEDIDAAIQLEDGSSEVKKEESEAAHDLKILKALCEQLAAFDLEKFEDIKEEKLAELLEPLETSFKTELRESIRTIPALNKEVNADRLMASLAKNLTPAQLEAVEHPPDEFEAEYFADIAHYYSGFVNFIKKRLMIENSTLIIDETLPSKYMTFKDENLFSLDYVDLASNRILYSDVHGIATDDRSTKNRTRFIMPETFTDFKSLGQISSLSKAYIECTTYSDIDRHDKRTCVFEVCLPSTEQDFEKDIKGINVIISKADHSGKQVQYFFALHDRRLTGIEVNRRSENLTVFNWELNVGKPSLETKVSMEDLCIIDESSRDLFQEFKDKVKEMPSKAAIIAKDNQLLIAHYFRTNPEGTEGVSHVFLLGLSLKTKERIVITKLNFPLTAIENSASYRNFGDLYSLIRLQAKSGALACLITDLAARKCHVYALKGLKIVRLVSCRMPPRFAHLYVTADRDPVIDARRLRLTFWTKEKVEGKLALTAEVFRFIL